MSDSESARSESINGGNTQLKFKGDTQSQGNDRVPTAASSRASDNPFKIPSDDLIFTFKEDEKARK